MRYFHRCMMTTNDGIYIYIYIYAYSNELLLYYYNTCCITVTYPIEEKEQLLHSGYLLVKHTLKFACYKLSSRV